MKRWYWVVMTTAAMACAARGGAHVTDAPSGSPSPPPPLPPPPVASARPVAPHPTSLLVRYGPSATRYLVRRRLHIEQSFGGPPQVQDLGAAIFVHATITGPADASGYPATFTVDSVVPDSGTPPPVAENVARARALVFSGRLGAQGEFQSAAASDTAVAHALAQLVGNFRDFLPRIPADGVRLGAVWSDTLSVTQRAGGSEITRRSVAQSSAAAWEMRSGARALHLDVSATYSVAGSGENGGQAFQMAGAGALTAQEFLAEDGRYVGGESRDSAALTISLPAQALSIPVTQILYSTVTLLPAPTGR